MSEPVYLYSYGRRRHIANPNGTPARRPEFSRESYCGQWHDTEARMVDTFQWADVPEKAIARKKTEPICQRCQKAHDKAVAR